MTFVPASADDVLDGESPIHGDCDDVAAQRDVVQAIAADAGTFLMLMGSAVSALSNQSGRGVSRIVEKIDGQVTPGTRVLIDSTDAALRALDVYSGEIANLHQRARRVVAMIEASLETIRWASRSLAEIAEQLGVCFDAVWDEGPAWQLPEPVQNEGDMSLQPWAVRASLLRLTHEEKWRSSASRWHRAVDDIEAERQSWHDLSRQRREAEQALRGALAATAIGQLITLGSASTVGYRQTIAVAVSGEIWGSSANFTSRSTSHPLLARLIGSRSGDGVWDQPPDPTEVAAAWAQLSEAERHRVIEEVPWVVGNLPGLPFVVRDEANRRLLEYYVVHRDGLGRSNQEAIDAILKVLEKERFQISQRGTADPPIHVVALDLNGTVPRSAIGYGDLDLAQNLIWQIPGMLNDTHQGLPGWDRASRNLYARQFRQLEVAGRATEGAGLIAYFEYDTPDPLTVLSPGSAREAAPRLAAELDGAYATRSANMALSNHGVLAHSYGTSVAANALLLTEHPVQSLTLIASAGLDGGRVKSLRDLNVDHDFQGRPRVYSTMAATDGTAPFGSNISGRLQPNPQAAWSDELQISGAQIFSADGSGNLNPTEGHSIVRGDARGYLDQRTQSLDSVAKLTIGESARVIGGLAFVGNSSPGPPDRIRSLTPGGP